MTSDSAAVLTPTAVTDERLRMSRELHDSVSQALYAISLTAKAARRHLPDSPERSVDPIDQVIALADSSLSEMRSMIFDLRPEVLATEGHVAALLQSLDDGRRVPHPAFHQLRLAFCSRAISAGSRGSLR